MSAIMRAAVLLIAVALPAQTQEVNQSRRFEPDSCGPVDPNYIRLANETGGQPLFLQPSEISQSSHFMRESSAQNHVLLLWASAPLQGAAREFRIPVDSTVERLTFVVSYDKRRVRVAVIRPAGTAVNPSDNGIEDTLLNCSRTLTIKNPDPGVWMVRISGEGTFWLQAMGRSETDFITARFVRKGGRPGHEGFFRIPGQPLEGKPATLEIHFSGELQNEALKLVGEDGRFIKQIELTREDSGQDGDHEYLIEIELPKTPFRVVVAGTDEKGLVSERCYAPLFHAESVEVEPSGQYAVATPGEVTTLNFTVRNTGPAAAFHVTAANGLLFPSKIEPAEIFLNSGESKTIAVDITVPADTQDGKGFDLSVVASSVPAKTSNSSVVHLSVFHKR